VILDLFLFQTEWSKSSFKVKNVAAVLHKIHGLIQKYIVSIKS